MTGNHNNNRGDQSLRLAVIYNPTAGSRSPARYRQVMTRLAAAGCVIREFATLRRGDAEATAAALDPEAWDRVVAAGGDGTVNEVANGLLRNGHGAGRLPLALLPLGTANVLAAEIGLGRSAESIAAAVLRGRPQAVSVGEALGRGGRQGRAFLVMAGAGLDAHVVASLHPTLKRRLGKGAYVLEALRQLLWFPFPGYEVEVGGVTRRAASVIVAKGHFYAGRFVLAPGAALAAPEFRLCLFERQGRLAALGYAAALLLGRAPRLKSLRRLSARELAISGPAGDPLQGDGDIIARLPVRIRLLVDALTLVYPPAAQPESPAERSGSSVTGITSVASQ